MKNPRSAALAGIIFSALMMTSQVLIWFSIPADPLTPGVDLVRHSNKISTALNLLPFAGIAFLWFIGVIRDHLGALEDRFFATVMLGSGLLYVAMVFSSTVMAGALIHLLGSPLGQSLTSADYALTRAEIYRYMSVFATKMAAMFMFSSSTMFLHTGLLPRWLAYVGYLVGLVLLLSVGTVAWTAALFPLWVILVSGCLLVQHESGQVTI